MLALAGAPLELPLTPSARRRVRRVEVRLDLVPPDQWAHRLRDAERAFPAARMLATLRLTTDGGRWAPEDDRAQAFDRILSLPGWDAVDIESDAPDLEEILQVVERRGPDLRRVVSRHSFRAVSTEEAVEQVGQVAARARELRGSVAKWAGVVLDMDETCPELVRALSVWNGPGIPAIFPMGLGAEPWRIACALVPGGWAYGHDGTGAVAPGQLSWKVLEALLGSIPRSERWDAAWFEGVRRATALALREEVGE